MSIKKGWPYCLAFSLCLFSSLAALPKGGLIRHRHAEFIQKEKSLKIKADDNTIIDFDSFNIGLDESVEFIQPSSYARVLNRVIGGGQSQILGRLYANGKLYLINPAGIYFGREALVEVGALYASAGAISDHDFLSERDYFDRMSESIINEGFIQGQVVHLMGRRVINKGSIVAPKGVISLISATSVLIGKQQGRVFFEFPKALVEDLTTQEGVIQEGSLVAEEGQIFLGAADLYAITLQTHSKTKAKEVELLTQGGSVEIAGSLEAQTLEISAPKGIDISGEIQVIDKALLASDTFIRVGGLLKVGGGELSLQTLSKEKMELGDSFITSDDLQNIEAHHLVVGSEFTTQLVLNPLSPLHKIKKITLRALGEGGKVFLKTKAELPSLKLQARDSITLYQPLFSRGSIEISGHLQESLQGAMPAPITSLLKLSKDASYTGPLSLHAAKDLTLESVELQSDGQVSWLFASEKLNFEKTNLFQGLSKIQAPEVIIPSSGMLIAKEAISLASDQLKLEGSIKAPSLDYRGIEQLPITIGASSSNKSISLQDLDLLEVNSLSVGSLNTPEISVFSLGSTPIEKFSLKAKRVHLLGSGLDFDSLKVQAPEKIQVDAIDLKVRKDLWLASNEIFIDGSADWMGRSILQAFSTTKLSGNLRAKQLIIEGGALHLENAHLQLKDAYQGGSLRAGDKSGQWLEKIYMDENSRIDASGDDYGGRVDLLAFEEAKIDGVIEARGGVKGGFVEVSAKEKLLLEALIDLKGPKKGTLLIDPDYLVIGEAIEGYSRLSPSLLLTLLQNADTTVEAARVLTLNSPLIDEQSYGNSLTLLSGDEIRLFAPIELKGKLFLQAAGHISLETSIKVASSLSIQAPSLSAKGPHRLLAKDLSFYVQQLGGESNPIVADLEKVAFFAKGSYFYPAFDKWQSLTGKFQAPSPSFESPKTIPGKVERVIRKKKRRGLGASDDLASSQNGLENTKSLISIEKLIRKLKRN